MAHKPIQPGLLELLIFSNGDIGAERSAQGEYGGPPNYDPYQQDKQAG
jgi:hypothetical protein